MFTHKELVVIAKALVTMEKSVLRLAAKEEQPETVAAEYRKVGAEIGDILKKTQMELVKLESGKK